jgi:hypothetical protein
MTISTAQKARLNKMNKAFQAVSGGNILAGIEGLATLGTVVSGSYAVSATEANASRVVLTTGLTAVKGFFSSYLRSGSVTAVTFCAGSVAGTLTVLYNNSASLVTADVASYIAF